MMVLNLPEAKVMEVTAKTTRNDILGSVSRSLTILDLLADAPRGLEIRAIADHMGINISTCYHTLNTLLAAGYILRDSDTGRVTLGHKVARLYHGYERQLGVASGVRYILAGLAEESHECVVFSMFKQGRVIIAEVTDSREHLRVGGHHLGPVGDLHARAIGKAILASTDPHFVDQHFAKSPPRAMTKHTLTSLEAIRADFARTRERGYSLDLEELNEGVSAVAVPFFSWSGEVLGAIAITAPSARFEAKREPLVTLVKNAAASVTAAMRGPTGN